MQPVPRSLGGSCRITDHLVGPIIEVQCESADSVCSVSLQIVIEVLALNVSEYRMRFKYEQELFMKEHQIESARSDSGHGALSELQKGRLSQFVLSPLTTTRAVIRKGLKQSEQSKQSASGSMSPAIDIMDMLNVNQSPSDRADPDPVRSELSLSIPLCGPLDHRMIAMFHFFGGLILAL